MRVWVLFGIVIIAMALELLRWAWLASHRGGFALISWQTWEEIRIYVFCGVVLIALRLAWFAVEKARKKPSMSTRDE